MLFLFLLHPPNHFCLCIFKQIPDVVISPIEFSFLNYLLSFNTHFIFRCPKLSQKLLFKVGSFETRCKQGDVFLKTLVLSLRPSPPFFLPGIAFLHKVGHFCGRLTCWIFLIASCCILNLFLCSPCFLCPGCQPSRLD